MRWSAEVRAAGVLLALAALGTVVRACGAPGMTRGAPGAAWAPGSGERPARDSVAAGAARLTRPLAHGERVDVNRATAAELDRLPRVGPALAARIVRARESGGPFADLAALDQRVSGVGPALREAIAPHVDFGGSRPVRSRPAPGPALVPVNRADAAALEALPGIGPALAAAIVAERERGGPFRTADDLDRVRGIGPALVERLRGRILLP